MVKALAQLTGVVAGRYEVVRLVDSGGMAQVYLATDRKLDRPVALKILKPELAPAVGTERFSREIEITGHLQHPHVLPLLDAGDVEGVPFYVMPYVEGESLASRLLREHQIPVEEAVGIARQIAEALAYAHGRGVVHRDIKPGNILLAGDDVLVADFGIARALDVAGGVGLTSSGIAIGTPAYMSPEQAAGTGEVDRRSDIYSLACVLYEMLVGEPPFTGPSVQAVIARQASEPVPRISVVRATVPPALERVIAKALAKVPADRYNTALEFRDALARVDLAATRERPAVPWRPLAVAAAVVAAIAGAWAGFQWLLQPGQDLDDNRIVVYPLISPGGDGTGRLGEDMATVIGHTLDGTGPLRAVDAWGLLDDETRADIRRLSLRDARGIARAQRSGRFMTGRVVLQGDQAVVYLDLHDVRGDTSLRGVSAASAVATPWQAALGAVTALLPTIIPTGSPEVADAWIAREPQAVASFLLGERAFRRGAFDSAMTQYGNALAADTMFALAAIRGAQAAGWIHDTRVAQAMIDRAVALADRLTPRDAALARGFAATIAGRADTAFAQLHAAVELDPELATGWWMLGDAYTHLIPARGPPDSLAEVALIEAHRLDSAAVHPLFHLIEIAIRKGERERTDGLWRRFVALEPDSALYHRLRIMRACTRDGVDAVDWDREAPIHAADLVSVGRSLAAGGSQIACAQAAFAAVLRGDTVSDVYGAGRRWVSLLGLQSLLLAQGHADAVAHLIDSAAASGMAGSLALYPLDAAVTGLLADRAAQVAAEDAKRYGPEYRGSPSTLRLWVLAVWEASRGNAPLVAAIADELDQRADTTGSRLDRLLADAVAAHATLARGDSAAALEMLLALRTTAPREEMPWHLAEPLAFERLLLAELLLAWGRAWEALAVAQVFDSQEPLIYALYLRRSLEVRVRAAAAAGYADLARTLRGRLERVQAYTMNGR